MFVLVLSSLVECRSSSEGLGVVNGRHLDGFCCPATEAVNVVQTPNQTERRGGSPLKL